jgi:hypothetical protein
VLSNQGLLPIFPESQATQDEDDDDEPKALLECDPEWDPKTGGAGRERCLQWDLGHIIPSFRKQLTFENGKTEHEAARDMLKEVVPKKDGTDWAQMRIIASFFRADSRGKAPGQRAPGEEHRVEKHPAGGKARVEKRRVEKHRVEKHQKSSRVSRFECLCQVPSA